MSPEKTTKYFIPLEGAIITVHYPKHKFTMAPRAISGTMSVDFTPEEVDKALRCGVKLLGAEGYAT